MHNPLANVVLERVKKQAELEHRVAVAVWMPGDVSRIRFFEPALPGPIRQFPGQNSNAATKPMMPSSGQQP
ncbi:MAG: hypothetical protein JJT82_07030 [Legionellaceae bacterium]|nr:hypothetical protein [Legionellaceae bacterium]